MLEWKKHSFGNLERFSTKCTTYFFPFSFSFSIENEKKWPPPLYPLFAPNFGGVLVPLAPKNLGRNAPIPEDSFWAKNRILIILTIFAWTIPLIKGFLICRNECWSPFFSQTQENLDNPEKVVLSGLSGFSSAGRKKKDFRFGVYTPKNIHLKNKKDVFFICA